MKYWKNLKILGLALTLGWMLDTFRAEKYIPILFAGRRDKDISKFMNIELKGRFLAE